MSLFEFSCLDFPSRPAKNCLGLCKKIRHVWTSAMLVSMSLNFQKSGLLTFPTKGERMSTKCFTIPSFYLAKSLKIQAILSQSKSCLMMPLGMEYTTKIFRTLIGFLLKMKINILMLLIIFHFLPTNIKQTSLLWNPLQQR